MIRVVLIDDEVLARVGIRSMVDWQSIGCELCGDAGNGEEGLRLIMETHPDIVITDIKMPVMNGLDMMRAVLATPLRPRFVILSSFDDFKFVKEAMQLGARDYLIKLEITPDQLGKTLGTLRDEILEERVSRRETSRSDVQVKKSLTDARKEFLRRLLDLPQTKSRELLETASYLELNLNLEHAACMAFCVEQVANESRFSAEEDRALLDFCIENIASEVLNDFFPSCLLKYPDDIYVAVYSPTGDMPADTLRQEMRKMAERLADLLAQYVNVHIAVGFSGDIRPVWQIHQSLKEALRAAERAVFQTRDKITFHHDLQPLQEAGGTVHADHQLAALSDAIRCHDPTRTEAAFASLAQALCNGIPDRTWACDLLSRTGYLVRQAASAAALRLNFFGDGQPFFAQIQEMQRLPQMTQWLRDLELAVIQAIQTPRNEDQTAMLISRAQKYIQENLFNNISLGETAHALGMSHSYFSTLFKQYTGENYVDYVTRLKIEEARRLLQSGNVRVYEAASAVGFDNPYYFSRVFKKVTGLTPTEFIEKNGI